jgi:three-Cys-motif partner protein
MKDYSFYKGREQTYLKHLVLENYLERLSWIIGFGSEYGKICYVDGFSGPWKSGSENYEDTSIRISLDILSKTKSGLQELGKSVKFKCIFVEKEEEQFDELKSILMQHPRSGIETHPLHGEFEELIEEVLSEAEGFFTLFFIDPSGWTGYGLRKIAPIVSRPKSEIVINFMFDYINRFLKPGIDQSLAKSFDDLFGDAGWHGQILEGQGREDSILNYYKECLRKVGRYQYVVNTAILKPTEDRTYYHLIYATHHRKGLKTFKEVDAKMQPQQQRIRKEAIYEKDLSRTGQESLFGSQMVDTKSTYTRYRSLKFVELEKLLKEMLHHQPSFSFSDFLLRALQIEIIYEKDIKDLIAQAKKDGRIQIPNWGKNQRKPNEKSIIQRKGS